MESNDGYSGGLLAGNWGFWLKWVVASAVGWVVGGPVGGFFGWAALGVVYGAVTGRAITWLRGQPRHQLMSFLEGDR